MCCILLKNNHTLLLMFVNKCDPWIVVESVFGKLDKTEKERWFVFYIRLITRFPLAT